MEKQSTIDNYSEALELAEELRKEKAQLLESIIPDNIREQINDINAEFDYRILEFEELAQTFREELKEEVLAKKKTIRGKKHMAVYIKGRISWEDSFLTGLAVSIPEILQARKEGNPSMQVRKAE